MAAASIYNYLAFRNVIRDRKKTITSGLGITLAVMIILASSIASTLQARAVMSHE